MSESPEVVRHSGPRSLIGRLFTLVKDCSTQELDGLPVFDRCFRRPAEVLYIDLSSFNQEEFYISIAVD